MTAYMIRKPSHCAHIWVLEAGTSTKSRQRTKIIVHSASIWARAMSHLNLKKSAKCAPIWSDSGLGGRIFSAAGWPDRVWAAAAEAFQTRGDAIGRK